MLHGLYYFKRRKFLVKQEVNEYNIIMKVEFFEYIEENGDILFVDMISSILSSGKMP